MRRAAALPLALVLTLTCPDATTTDLATRRLLIADEVAAAKFGTSAPIDDPARERQVVDAAVARAVEIGLAADPVRIFFRDQVEANKVVQRGLFARWTAHPEQRPTRRPDLAGEVRPKLDRLTTAMLEDLRDGPDCGPPPRLDPLHRAALRKALASVC